MFDTDRSLSRVNRLPSIVRHVDDSVLAKIIIQLDSLFGRLHLGTNMKPQISDDGQQKLKAIRQSLDEIRQAAEQDPDYQAKLVDLVLNQSAGIYLTGSNQGSPLRCLSTTAFQNYFDALYEQIGSPAWKDPLHRLMVEQLVISHHVIGQLMMNSSNCKDLEALRTQVVLAVQLMSEFRRMTQAVNAYVPSTSTPQIKTVAISESSPSTKSRKSHKGVA